MQHRIVNPIAYPHWNQSVGELEGNTIFHSAEWAQVLSMTYGYHPNYLIAAHGGQVTCVLPLMGIASWVSGRRAVALPFTDRCSPLGEDVETLRRLWDKALRLGALKQWNYIEIRGDHALFDEKPSAAKYRLHLLNVDRKLEHIKKQLRDSTRRNIKKAVINDVKVTRRYDITALMDFYRLNCHTRKRHGLPPQPKQFFVHLHTSIIAKGKGFILLAIYKDKPVAGGVFFTHNETILFKYGASAIGFERLRPNNALIWEAISYASKRGFKTFDFGRTEVDNRGLLQFKRGWGGREGTVSYFKYDMKEDCFVSSTSKTKTSYPFFQKMPLPLLKLSGRILYRHVG